MLILTSGTCKKKTYETESGVVSYWVDDTAGRYAPWLVFLPGLTADHRLFEAELCKPEYGRITGNGKTLYYHVMEGMIGGIPLIGLKKEQISRITLLKTGRSLPVSETWITGNYPDIVFTDLGEDPRLPDTADTVIRVERK